MKQVKSHMQRFINGGNGINTAKDMEVAIESYGGVKGCYATIAEIQDSFQSMTKHSMTGIQALNNFLFEPAGLRAWKAYNVGTGKFFSLAQLKKYGTPQVPTGKDLQPFSRPRCRHVSCSSNSGPRCQTISTKGGTNKPVR